MSKNKKTDEESPIQGGEEYIVLKTGHKGIISKNFLLKFFTFLNLP